MSEDDRPSSLKQLDAQLREARERERRSDPAERPAGGDDPAAQSGWGVAFRIGTELVAGVAVGVGIGWGLDLWLGTKPWLMVVFFLLGSAAGMLNVYRGLQRMAGSGGKGERR